jgi:cytochrome P450 family 135
MRRHLPASRRRGLAGAGSRVTGRRAPTRQADAATPGPLTSVLPDGPAVGPLLQTVALHRDPLGVLRRAAARHGDVFTLRLATVRPIVVVARPDEVEPLLAADPRGARAGEARRRMLPVASPRSIFGSDGERHRVARARLAALFAPEAIQARRAEMADIAVQHVSTWPRSRPMRLLPRLRALVDAIFVRCLLRVEDEERAGAVAAAIGQMLWTPGNPPISIPGAGDGLIGAAAAALFERKRAPLSALLSAEIDARRRDRAGDRADILGRLLRDEPELPTAAVVDELLALLMAAQEPAAAALAWLLERLARAPELSEGFGAAGQEAATEAIVCETLRLRPAAIAALRRLTEPRRVAGHRLPTGAVVMMPIPLLHRDPRSYAVPDAFRPRRWFSGSPPAAFWPFGGGSRGCVGEVLARTYLTSIVPTMLRRIGLRTLAPQPERMVLRGTILVPHRGGLVVARER